MYSEPLINQFNRILLVTAERVGDALFQTPAIRYLKKSLPQAQLDVLTFSDNAAQVFKKNPAITEIHIASGSFSANRIANQYPLVINLMHEMEKHLTNIKTEYLSIGKAAPNKHRAEQVLDFVRFLLTSSAAEELDLDGYDLFPEDTHEEKITAMLANEGLDLKSDKLVGIQLGCHRVARRGWKFWNKHRHRHIKVWAIENYLALAKRLYDEHGIRVILTGSTQERFLGNKFIKKFPQAVNLIGKTSLFDIAALMKQLNLYVTHDTGTLHIACAMDTPSVSLFGATAVHFTGPYPHKEQFTIISKGSMSDISVDQVYETVLAKLEIPLRH